VGSQQRGRPRIGWLNDAYKNMKVVKVKSWKELALKGLGTTWLRKPKPTKGFKSNGRRRRRRDIQVKCDVGLWWCFSLCC